MVKGLIRWQMIMHSIILIISVIALVGVVITPFVHREIMDYTKGCFINAKYENGIIKGKEGDKLRVQVGSKEYLMDSRKGLKVGDTTQVVMDKVGGSILGKDKPYAIDGVYYMNGEQVQVDGTYKVVTWLKYKQLEIAANQSEKVADNRLYQYLSVAVLLLLTFLNIFILVILKGRYKRV